MSIKNKIDWCLEKAEREKEEGKKHRGLLKIEIDKEKAREHIKKAEHNLSAVDYFNIGRFSDWSMSAVFYCIYQCFLAIAAKFGYESRNQECTIALIKYLKEQKKIDIEERFIETLESQNEQERHETTVIEKREFYTYGTTILAKKEEIERGIQLCKDCLDQTRDIVFE